ncbi:type II secretion protein N [Steroidobacter agaridevorans]|uniref:Type II secretion system protein N n=1 Tax=Steroidobacter agaridevorans TaxID=2695856 RepID=A0A829YJC1_9GAMM|nr:type II secretion system protein N [Steroidobacter agaridevorans]GFE83474.1 type II secretion protein N [Steroidobacter agaridevorans]GFE86644.1 type II secretion protein N [Steroidobacter agaridevorans]
MKRLWPLVALGVGAFLIFAVVTLPASIVVSWLASSGVYAGGVSGTIWNGRAQVLQVQGANIGSVEWKLHALPLLTAHANADVKVTRIDGFAQTKLSVGPTGTMNLTSLTASLPLSALPANAIPGGWAGTLNGRFEQLTLEKGWPTKVNGSLEVMDLNGPARNPSKAGSYRILFDPAASTADVLKGAISDAGDGPLQLNGTLQLKPDRSYALEALIAARPDAPRNLVQALEFLGPPDAQGRRQFNTEGTL